MTRRLAKLAAVYLLLGLVATLAAVVLPQLAGASVGRYSNRPAPLRLTTPWPIEVPDSWPEAANQHLTRRWVAQDAAFTWHVRKGETMRIVTNGTPTDWTPDDLFHVRERRIGWPWRAVQGCSAWAQWAENGVMTVDDPTPSDLRGGLQVPGVGRIVASPIWPGLIANTVFYAAVFLGLHQLFGFTRRSRRRRRGRCAGCGYDLSGIEGACPECGVLTNAQRACGLALRRDG